MALYFPSRRPLRVLRHKTGLRTTKTTGRETRSVASTPIPTAARRHEADTTNIIRLDIARCLLALHSGRATEGLPCTARLQATHQDIVIRIPTSILVVLEAAMGDRAMVTEAMGRGPEAHTAQPQDMGKDPAVVMAKGRRVDMGKDHKAAMEAYGRAPPKSKAHIAAKL
mmetsp:Transcript_33524/g.53929  ORF Transcript_33524/g.53929 Transcript_33524/m.53929 type:complete len:169 (+) Transcript_33524:249-755(+)